MRTFNTFHNIFSYSGITLLVIIMSCCLGGCVTEKDEPAWSLHPGDRLPEFSVTLNTGETITTQSLEGKKSIIIFFTTSCSDCQRALPKYQQWYDEIQAEGEEINFICISRAEDTPSVNQYWTDNGFTMPYSAQLTRTVYDLFASSGVPRVYIADPDLIITEVRLDE